MCPNKMGDDIAQSLPIIGYSYGTDRPELTRRDWAESMDARQGRVEAHDAERVNGECDDGVQRGIRFG